MNDRPKPSDEIRQRGPVESLLGLFTEVRRGEAGTLLLLTLDVFLILAAYYVIKPVREQLILDAGTKETSGAVLKSYSSFFQTLVLLVFVPAYARLASAVPRRTLINAVTLFFCACLIGFFLLSSTNVPRLEVVFYIWVGIFNVSVVAQFWSFANDLYTPEQGKRLFAVIAFGASAGAVLGPSIAGKLFDPLGAYPLLLVACAMLIVSLLISNVVDTRERRHVEERRQAKGGSSTAPEGTRAPEEEPIGKDGAFKLVFGNRYLLLIALLILFLNWVNTTGEFILSSVVESASANHPDDPNFKGKFYASFFQIVNIVSMLVQLFLVSRIVRYLGMRIALLILPVIAFGGYLLVAFVPILPLIRWTKTAENATDYSLQNTLRGMLFLPTTREQKYKAKQAIDTFFARAGDALQAALVYVGTTYLAFQTQHFAIFNLVLVGIWLVLAWMVGREFVRRTEGSPGNRDRAST